MIQPDRIIALRYDRLVNVRRRGELSTRSKLRRNIACDELVSCINARFLFVGKNINYAQLSKKKLKIFRSILFIR